MLIKINVMKAVNILSVVSAWENTSQDIFQKYLANFGIELSVKGVSLSGIKDYELNGLRELVRKMYSVDGSSFIYDGYYLGYTIPQISAEFDLLRFGNEYIVNIELKTQCDVDKVQKQLEKHKYYLNFLKKPLHLYTYVESTDTIYKYNEAECVVEIVDISELFGVLQNQVVYNIEDVDLMFNPSNYLVSPFNSTEAFMRNEYFLTQQQTLICKAMLRSIDAYSETPAPTFNAVTGGAGTGKTLLLYHIAREIIARQLKLLIIHCAPLNNGHNALIEDYGWNIIHPKFICNTDMSLYDIIIVDEAQRIYEKEFGRILSSANEHNKYVIFSYDERQYLDNYELKRQIHLKIGSVLTTPIHKLTDKVRTNKRVSDFIKQFLNNKKNDQNADCSGVSVFYYKNRVHAKLALQSLADSGWVVPKYTPGTRSTFKYEDYILYDSESAHEVVGQEFDNVVAVVDNNFMYNENGDLTECKPQYYNQRQMLYQIITRTRNKLCIVIIDNEPVLDRCMTILNR